MLKNTFLWICVKMSRKYLEKTAEFGCFGCKKMLMFKLFQKKADIWGRWRGLESQQLIWSPIPSTSSIQEQARSLLLRSSSSVSDRTASRGLAICQLQRIHRFYRLHQTSVNVTETYALTNIPGQSVKLSPALWTSEKTALLPKTRSVSVSSRRRRAPRSSNKQLGHMVDGKTAKSLDQRH